MRLHNDQRGIKGVELGMGMLMIGLLAAVATPLMSQVSDQVTDVAAAVEIRSATLADAADGVLADGETRVAGVQLVKAADGATCRWTTSDSGTVFGVWESGTTTLYGSFDLKPDPCPTAQDAEAVGFGDTFVSR